MAMNYLSAPAITELTVETAPKIILKEFLSEWFDGQSHAIANQSGVEAIFPLADIAFDQGPVNYRPLSSSGVQNAEGLEIRVLVDPTGYTTAYIDSFGGGKVVKDNVAIDFWIRARQHSAGSGDSNYLANRASNLLRAILSNPYSRYPLAQKGIIAIVPQHAKTYADDQYAMRLIRCRATILYKVQYTT